MTNLNDNYLDYVPEGVHVYHRLSGICECHSELSDPRPNVSWRSTHHEPDSLVLSEKVDLSASPVRVTRGVGNQDAKVEVALHPLLRVEVQPAGSHLGVI